MTLSEEQSTLYSNKAHSFTLTPIHIPLIIPHTVKARLVYQKNFQVVHKHDFFGSNLLYERAKLFAVCSSLFAMNKRTKIMYLSN